MESSAVWVPIAAAVLGIVCSAMGTILWFLYQSVRQDAKAARDDTTAVTAELARYKLYAAEHFVTQTELTKAVSNLEKSIERLIEAVNQNSKETRDGFTQLHERIDKKADK